MRRGDRIENQTRGDNSHGAQTDTDDGGSRGGPDRRYDRRGERHRLACTGPRDSHRPVCRTVRHHRGVAVREDRTALIHKTPFINCLPHSTGTLKRWSLRKRTAIQSPDRSQPPVQRVSISRFWSGLLARSSVSILSGYTASDLLPSMRCPILSSDGASHDRPQVAVRQHRVPRV